jgi:hypothetical protein
MRRSPVSALALTIVCLMTVPSVDAQDDDPIFPAASVRPVPADPVATRTADSHEVRRPAGRRSFEVDPYDLISGDDLLGLLEELTSIRPHRGWRTSTTSGEAEALDWIESSLSELWFLSLRGLEVERETFRTFTGVEFWETTVTLRRDDEDFTAPADGAAGHRDVIPWAIRFDSDGVLNDRNRDPVVVDARPLIVRTADEVYGLPASQVAGRVVFLDYAAVDRSIIGTNEAVTRAWALIDRQPAAVVMVTTFSNAIGVSHGSFAGWLNPYTWVDHQTHVPVLSLRMEDLEPFGIANWSDLAEVDRATVRWDVDLFAPGDSGFLMARIPGRDSSRAVILGAHIDSPNTPGAFDDGSGSVGLLGVARALDRARVVPPVDVYLVWFGSHERGLYGSANFTARHGDILDRAIAMLQMDCLGHPLDGLVNEIWLEAWSYEVHGDASIPWPSYLFSTAAERGVATQTADVHGLVSDNSSFAGYGVPNADMVFMDPSEGVEVHYANHLHDPYDGIDLARLEGQALADMTTILLAAALETGADAPDLQPAPVADRRALFVGSHTEGVHMSPAGMSSFGMTLTWEGFDVDMVPYGRAVTADDLADADLVVVLPVHDYPSPDWDTSVYDEEWTTAELDVLEDYVSDGGLLVLTNTAHRLKYYNIPLDRNEDWSDVNPLADRFGVSFRVGTIRGDTLDPVGNHPLVTGLGAIRVIEGNGHGFRADTGEVLATAVGEPAVVIVPHGAGEVLVLADLGMLGAAEEPAFNLLFWENLARYAR